MGRPKHARRAHAVYSYRLIVATLREIHPVGEKENMLVRASDI